MCRCESWIEKAHFLCVDFRALPRSAVIGAQVRAVFLEAGSARSETLLASVCTVPALAHKK